MPGTADLLASFLPGPLRLRLATRPEVPEGLLAEETELVAMQMDVSGFSGLTERLAADAPWAPRRSSPSSTGTSEASSGPSIGTVGSWSVSVGIRWWRCGWPELRWRRRHSPRAGAPSMPRTRSPVSGAARSGVSISESGSAPVERSCSTWGDSGAGASSS